MTEERRKDKAQQFLSWLDRRHIISNRGFVLWTTVGMTVYVTIESFRFAYTSQLPGSDTALVIGAITVPFCALQKYVFDAYMKAKDGNP